MPHRSRSGQGGRIGRDRSYRPVPLTASPIAPSGGTRVARRGRGLYPPITRYNPTGPVLAKLRSTMSLPTISAVVPSLNQARFLGQALDSILSQDYPELEIIVMDGGSTDGSLDVIRAREPRLTYWQSSPDGGQSAAINRGMERASGQIVCWLNSDDLLCPGALRRIGQAAIDHPGRGMYIGNGFRLDDATGRKVPYCPRPLAFSRRVLAEGGAYVHQPSTFFSRAAWNAVGGLNEGLHYCMDWDIFLRISARFQVVILDEFLAITREYEATKTGSGGMERAAEIRRMIADNTGVPLSTGATIFLIEAMLDEIGEALGPSFFRHLALARNIAARRLSDLTGSPDSFPSASDPDVVKYGAASPAAPARPAPGWRRGLDRLVAARPRSMLYDLATGAVVAGAALHLTSRSTALARLRRWHERGLFAQDGRDGLGGGAVHVPRKRDR